MTPKMPRHLRPAAARKVPVPRPRARTARTSNPAKSTPGGTPSPSKIRGGRSHGPPPRTSAASGQAAARLQAAQELARARLEEIEEIYRIAPVGLCVLDRDLRFVRINDRLAAMNGIPAAMHLGKRVSELLPKLGRAWEPAMRRVLRSGRPRLNVEITGETPAQPGVARSWLEQWLPLKDALGHVTGISIVVEETTARKRAEEALRSSENRLRTAAQTAWFGTFDADLLAGTVFWSPEMRSILGFSRDAPEPPAGTVPDFIHPDDFEGVREMLRRCFDPAGDGVISHEHRIVRPNGATRWVHLKGRVLFKGAKRRRRPVRASGILLDITDRKAEEEKLRAALAKAEDGDRLLAALMEHVPEGITIADGPDATLRMVSRHGEELLGHPHTGLTAAEFTARWKIYHPDGATPMEPADLPLVRAARDGETVANAEIIVANAQGRALPLLCNAVPIRAGDGAIAGAIVVWRDISERRRIEDALHKLNADLEDRVRERTAALAEAEAKFRGLVENTLDIPFRVDPNGTVRYVGPQARRYGFDPDSLTGRHFLDIVFPGDRQGMADAFRRADVGRAPFPSEFRVQSPDGTIYWFEEQGSLHRGPGGAVEGFVGVLRDVSARKQAEHALREYETNLRRLSSELALAEERERRRIAAEIHNELGQVLAMCQNELDRIDAGALPEAAARGAHRLRGLLERAAAGTRALTFNLSSPLLHTLGLAPALEQLCADCRKDSGIAFLFEDDGQEKPLAEADRIAFFRSVRELFRNIIRHARATEAHCALSRRGGRIRAEVRDNGMGFDAANAGMGFSPQGGFGLFNLREYAKHVGGRFEIESSPNAGTRIILEAPLDRRP